MKAAGNSADSNLFRYLSLGIWRGHNRVKHFQECFNKRSVYGYNQETTVPKNSK
jgi:hypothetical protein